MASRLPSPCRAGRLWGAAVLLLGSLAPACDEPPEPAHFRFEERRLQLFSRLDEVLAEEGFFDGSPRLLKLAQDPERNEDTGSLRLRVSPDSAIASRPVRVPGGARLELEIGLEWIDELAPDEGSGEALPGEPTDYATRYAVRFRPDGDGPDGAAEIELGARSLELASHAGATRVREPWALGPDELAPVAGRTGRFVLETRRTAGPVDLNVLPAWWSPVLVATLVPGERARSSVARERVVRDLLAEASAAAVTVGERPPVAGWRDLAPVPLGTLAAGEAITRRPVSIEPHFQTGPSPVIARGGTRPALAFAAPAEVAFGPPGDAGPTVSPHGRTLRFEVGVDASARTAPGVAVEVEVRLGGSPLATLRVDGAELAKGWSETREVALPDDAGRDALVLAVRAADLAEPFATSFAVADRAGAVVGRPATLARPWVALARPRIVAERTLAPQPSSDRARPSVLVLCAETLRADALDPWGGRDAPELGRWAERALVFDKAYSPASWTLPSVASMLTGLAPWQHGAVSGQADQLGDWCETLAEAAAWDGIRTGAFVTNDLIRANAGFAAGFETFVEARAANAGQIDRAFLDWLSERPGERFFAYLHYFEPHTPCNAPGELRDALVPDDLRELEYADQVERVKALKLGNTALAPETDVLRYLHGRYRGEVRSLDAHLGRLLDELERRGVLENTLVAFTADHGEEFGDHAWYGHGNFLYDEGVHVPLMLLGAGVTPGRVRGPVETLSLPVRVATTLGLDGLARALRARRPALPLAPVGDVDTPIWLASEQGIDLGEHTSPLTEDTGRLDPRPIRAVVLGGRKAILRFSRLPDAPTPEAIEAVLESFELYDLERDPDERRSLASTFADAPADLRREVRQRLTDELAATRHLHDDRLSSDARAALEALGYIDGADAKDGVQSD